MVSEKFELIAAEKAAFEVTMMCRLLGVSDPDSRLAGPAAVGVGTAP
jgi:hypothetical protein